MRRLPAPAFLTAVLLLAGPAPSAFAQEADVAAALAVDPLYLEPGAEDVDAAAVRAAIAAAADADFDLRVAVLGGGDAQEIAVDVGARLPGTTVVVFTPTAFGVASAEVSQGRLSDALAAAADELSGPDVAAGVAKLVDELESRGGPPLGLIATAAVVALLAVAIGGRLWDSRTRDRRQARRRRRRAAELTERVRKLGSRVVELSDRVELAESREASARYAEAIEIFDQADRRIAAAASMHDLDAVAADLERADQLLTQVDVEVRP